MRRSLLFLVLGLAVVGGCSDSDKGGVGPGRSYDVQTTIPAVTVRQDSTYQLAVTVMRDGTTAVANPTISYSVEDYSIASVSATGVVLAKKGGTTNVRAAFNGDTLLIPVTVTPKPVTSIALTLNFTGKDSGTVYALPGFPSGSFLKALVLSGTDTVYCNALACPNHATRMQRLVEFVSLDTAKASISDASASTANKNTRGQVNPKDTSAAYRRFVLRVPADNIADTVWLRFLLRPIDSITVRTDSFTVAGTTTRLAYSSNITRDSSIVLGVNMLNRLDTAYSLSSAGAPVRTRTNVTVTRPTMPRITWESANDNYAVVDNQGRVTGLRNTWLPGVGSTAAQRAANSDEPTCSSAIFKISATDTAYAYDRVLTKFPIPANYTPAVVATGCPATTPNPTPGGAPIPTNVPATVPRGVNCTSSVASGTATCTVVIRASVTDPVTGAVRRFLFNVVVQQP
jgi:hypothetical protein